MDAPRKFTLRMVLFVLAAISLLAALREALLDAFLANAVLNGAIVGVLVIGILFAFRRVRDLRVEIRWIEAFKRSAASAAAGTDAAAGATGKVAVSPKLLAPAAQMLAEASEGGMRLSALSMQSVLAGIGSRLEESREISRYLTGLLIFLGLLGTFWGLLGTISAIGGTIQGLTVDGTDMALMFDELKSGLESPLAGMGTAFSSSLFGLGGSLILGFMDLQASQAQTRFYNEVEDWLATVTRLSRGMDGADGSPGAFTTALLEQTADSIDRLGRDLARRDTSVHTLGEGLTHVAEAVAKLSDRMADQERQQREVSIQQAAEHKALVAGLEMMAGEKTARSDGHFDAATRDHIRNLDVGLKRLVDTQARQSERMIGELRDEFRLLARTIAAGLDTRAGVAPSASRANPSARGATAGTAGTDATTGATTGAALGGVRRDDMPAPPPAADGNAGGKKSGDGSKK